MSECKGGWCVPLKPICFWVGESPGMAVAKVNLQRRVRAVKLGEFFPHRKSVYSAMFGEWG